RGPGAAWGTGEWSSGTRGGGAAASAGGRAGRSRRRGLGMRRRRGPAAERARLDGHLRAQVVEVGREVRRGLTRGEGDAPAPARRGALLAPGRVLLAGAEAVVEPGRGVGPERRRPPRAEDEAAQPRARPAREARRQAEQQRDLGAAVERAPRVVPAVEAE